MEAQALIQPQVGDIVKNIFSGKTMTIVHISPDPVFSQDTYHCAWFTNTYHLKIELFLQKEITCSARPDMAIASDELQSGDKVIFKHQNKLENPVMKIIEIVEDTPPNAICKWLTTTGATDVEIVPVLSLKKLT
ncbi:DUF2158 domain-containing protein [Xanthocytophaga flava]|uniref:DUF2158 domain-containing protein n=1 Tax=Xanthocytophaga flava TaxID=3048013 RepID=UPI0028D2B250|nr:DUF2158 domain-containing protein [Xanthocytophaga flavus]MDJ1470190.1 DUF2158 domain-containing protein [Xanthocytophaga flavus]